MTDDQRSTEAPTVPPAEVIAAFGVEGAPQPLSGGGGRSYRVGHLVLKPLDQPLDSLAWQAEVLPRLPARNLRVAAPVPATDGTLVAHGWTATPYLEGHHALGRWSDVIAAGERLHAAMARLPRPAFLDARRDTWARADRLAWDAAATEGIDIPWRDQLMGMASGVWLGADQVVHGDLAGNVLFAEGLPPAVIDLAPYWRPALYASAIVVVDALVWEGADQGLVDRLPTRGRAAALARALVFRVAAEVLAAPARLDAIAPAYGPVVELVASLHRARPRS